MSRYINQSCNCKQTKMKNDTQSLDIRSVYLIEPGRPDQTLNTI